MQAWSAILILPLPLFAGDGELTRVELVRGFRSDERVRELLMPLLPTYIKNSEVRALVGHACLGGRWRRCLFKGA